MLPIARPDGAGRAPLPHGLGNGFAEFNTISVTLTYFPFFFRLPSPGDEMGKPGAGTRAVEVMRSRVTEFKHLVTEFDGAVAYIGFEPFIS
jgi:hypothetical protein